MRFAALQGEFAGRIRERHPELRNIDSLALVRFCGKSDEQVFVRSEAVLRVAAYLGGIWKLLLISRAIPGSIRDFLYDLLARHRYRLFGRTETCPLPQPAIRSRFLD
jgi:predicted DCC family thiol-disulfide oxidoreductase YuxK